jgi:type IV secretion system protein VirD4
MSKKRRGLLLGRTFSGKMIWLRDYVHLSVFAPTGAGKGVSFVIPWLLGRYQGTRIILDPKGELYRIVAEKNAALGRRAIRLDPFNVCGAGGCTWNVFDLVPSDLRCVDIARAIAEMVVIRDPEEKDRHWGDRAADTITGILAFILTNLTGPERSLSSLREIATSPQLFEGCAKSLVASGGVLARLGGSMLTLEDKEKASVLSTVHRHTNFLDSVAILEVTKSGWEARETLCGNLDVFFILPPHAIESSSRWQRLGVGTLCNLICREGMRKGHSCFFILDEVAISLGGGMPALDQALAVGRSFGIKLAFFWQSISQLQQVFKDREAMILDNCDAQLFFRVNSFETADRLSKALGTYTETAQSYSENSGSSYTAGAIDCHGQGGTNYSHGSTTTISVHQRNLLNPDEVMQATSGLGMICFLKGLPPVFCKRILYYSDPFFNPKRFAYLRKLSKRLVLSLLVGVAASALFNIRALSRGQYPWSPQKPEPVQQKALPTWPHR